MRLLSKMPMAEEVAGKEQILLPNSRGKTIGLQGISKNRGK